MNYLALVGSNKGVIMRTEELFDIYLAGLVVTEAITLEYGGQHNLNPAMTLFAHTQLTEQVQVMEDGERRLVLPRLENSRKAIDLLQSFVVDDNTLPIELLDDAVVIKSI